MTHLPDLSEDGNSPSRDLSTSVDPHRAEGGAPTFGTRWLHDGTDEVLAIDAAQGVTVIALVNPMAEWSAEAEQAFARLIASAPDLLSLLAEINDSPRLALGGTLRRKIRDLIAKAEGRS